MYISIIIIIVVVLFNFC